MQHSKTLDHGCWGSALHTEILNNIQWSLVTGSPILWHATLRDQRKSHTLDSNRRNDTVWLSLFDRYLRFFTKGWYQIYSLMRHNFSEEGLLLHRVCVCMPRNCPYLWQWLNQFVGIMRRKSVSVCLMICRNKTVSLCQNCDNYLTFTSVWMKYFPSCGRLSTQNLQQEIEQGCNMSWWDQERRGYDISWPHYLLAIGKLQEAVEALTCIAFTFEYPPV